MKIWKKFSFCKILFKGVVIPLYIQESVYQERAIPNGFVISGDGNSDTIHPIYESINGNDWTNYLFDFNRGYTGKSTFGLNKYVITAGKKVYYSTSNNNWNSVSPSSDVSSDEIRSIIFKNNIIRRFIIFATTNQRPNQRWQLMEQNCYR